MQRKRLALSERPWAVISEVVYLKLSQNTEVHEREVFLSQLGELWCRNKSI